MQTAGKKYIILLKMKLKDKILEIDKNYEDFEVATLGNYIPVKKIGNLIYISG